MKTHPDPRPEETDPSLKNPAGSGLVEIDRLKNVPGAGAQDDLPEFDPDLLEDDFLPCDNCDLPDACEDFGCAIKNGLRSPNEF